MSWSNHDAIHRHTFHAYEDFQRLRKVLGEHESELWHSLSHHLRHALYRTGLEVAPERCLAPNVRRRFHQ